MSGTLILNEFQFTTQELKILNAIYVFTLLSVLIVTILKVNIKSVIIEGDNEKKNIHSRDFSKILELNLKQ